MSAPYYEDGIVTVHHGDCIDVLRELPDASVDAVTTDPPYALEFMGRGWDKYTPLEFELWVSQWAAECLRVLKPGGHMLAFGGSRTWHRLAAGIEDAGFEIRDSISWLYASGFPKSLNVSVAIDKALGVDVSDEDYRGPVTDEAKAHSGFGTALKPAFEPVVVARKPLVGTVAANVLAYGTGALNIDASRVGDDTSRGDRYNAKAPGGSHSMQIAGPRDEPWAVPAGRWPTNVVLDESQAAELDRQSGTVPGRIGMRQDASDQNEVFGKRKRTESSNAQSGKPDTGGASRFFPTFRYEAKAPTRERPKAGEVSHPTVKPLDLMRWLVRLVTPPGGVVLEPFAGSGTTVEAAVLEGFRCVAIEREADYLPLIEQRLAKPMQQSLFDDLGGVA
jgi:DNA modification methylase